MENRSSNENWEIIDASASGWRLSLALDATTGGFKLVTFDPLDPFEFQRGFRELFGDDDLAPPFDIQLSMTKEIARLGEAWADLCIANKRATAAKNRLLRLALPLLAAWGYDTLNPNPDCFRRITPHAITPHADYAERSDEHKRLRYIVAGCEIDKAMAVIIASSVALSAEKERRALAAFIPARPAPAHRAGWL